ncbi:MAG: hypothetical protein Q4D89_07655 [Arachnia propionica]|uniref:hypothetical protein n=1 Tax=Arachnia propionica TaxID=1750 RepID=UPI0026F88DD6|nr:hypothetical protein [Arachnia propionica]
MKTKKRLIALAAAAMLFGSLTATPAQALTMSDSIRCYHNTTVGVQGAKYSSKDTLLLKLGGRQVYKGKRNFMSYTSRYRSTNWLVSSPSLNKDRSGGTCIVHE